MSNKEITNGRFIRNKSNKLHECYNRSIKIYLLMIIALSTFELTISENCSSIDIKLKPQCIRETVDKDLTVACCVLTPQNKNLQLPNICKSFAKAQTYPKTDADSGVIYDVTCYDTPQNSPVISSYNNPSKRENEVKSFTQNISCGKDSPSYQSDCFNSSTDTNSCCYYAYSDFKGCFWLGSVFNGNSNYNGIEFSCSVLQLLVNIGIFGLVLFIL